MPYLKKYKWVILFTLIFVDIFVWSSSDSAQSATLKVVFLDIGQGDSIYIEAPNGRQVMFDAGRDQSVLRRLGEVMPLFDRSIDMVVDTNPDADHIGGFIPILGKYTVGALLESGTFNSSKTYATLENMAAEKKIPDILLRRGMKIILDSKNNVYIDVLFPDRDVSSWTSNDGSVVARLVYGNDSVLLTGDATKLTEGILLQEEKDTLASEVLKAGHHGSHTSSGADFVKAVHPTYAIISVGAGNKYGHPHQETLDTLASAGVHVLRTDQLGTIVMESEGDGFTIVK